MTTLASGLMSQDLSSKQRAAMDDWTEPASGFRVTQLAGTDSLAPHWTSIADLSARALEPNPFYEPWMLSSVLERVVSSADLLFLLVFKNEPSARNPRLCGFFPVAPFTRHHGLPVRGFRLLGHMYCFVGAPLIDRDTASEVLRHFFSACRAFGAALVELPMMPSGGRFHQALVDVLHQQRLASRIERRYLRALYRVPTSPAGYLAESLSGKTRKQLRRQLERLAEIGVVEYSTVESADDPEAWLDEFLDLEAKGWKGKEKTAVASSPEHLRFFMEAGKRALERHAMFGSALRLDGRMIAGRIVVRSAEGSYLFKIAYDEQLAAFSPGTLLELQTMEHGLPDGVEWTDSCTSASNQVFRRLWLHNRIIEHIVVSPRSVAGDLAIGLVPVLRWIRDRLKRAAGTAATKVKTTG
jgi:CelD/BcsL family acetyltransferase involved in cellulose biosynthesis